MCATSIDYYPQFPLHTVSSHLSITHRFLYRRIPPRTILIIFTRRFRYTRFPLLALSTFPNFPTRVGNLKASTVCWRESARRVPLSGNHAAVDQVHRVAVEDLVLSQEDKPKRHRSAREISRETAILRSSVHRKIHHNLQLNCFKWRRAQLLSEANRISPLALINNLIVCNKSCYCSLLNRKLCNKSVK